jgi:hypothetical protein
VTKVIKEKNVELQISPKRTQIHSAYRLKKLIDPKASKFLNEERKKEKVQRINLQNLTQASNLKTRKMLRTRKLSQELGREGFCIVGTTWYVCIARGVSHVP